MNKAEYCTTFFDSYEDREDAFRKSVDFKLARRYGGPGLFWEDFRSISGNLSSEREQSRVASITSNPRDCLAFATGEQVLTAALMSAGNPCDSNSLSDIADRFGLTGLMAQPVRTLSGGESVKLALAKTHVSVPSCSSVVISSPFAWLSPANRCLLEAVIGHSSSNDKELSILALDGEDDLTPARSDDLAVCSGQPTISFAMKMTGARVPLTLSLNPLDDTVPYAAIENTFLELESPCLITGENGQGKSLVARAVAGSLALKGLAVISSAETEGRASLLFQDVQTQTLMRSFSELAAGGRGADRSSVSSIYDEIRREYHLSRSSAGSGESGLISQFSETYHTLLDVKTILVAVRLAGIPPALILDEPDWGLSRSHGLSFVSAVIAVAHRHAVPVMLISHKPWWQPMIRSHLSVSRTRAEKVVSTDRPVFTVSLKSGEVPA